VNPAGRLAAATILMAAALAPLAAARAQSAPPAVATAALPTPLSLVAEVENHVIDSAGHTSKSVARIYRHGNVIRLERYQINPIEISILDYDTLKEFRIYEQDRIYFEQQIPEVVFGRAWREGLISAEDPEIVVEKIRLRADVFEGHPTEIMLQMRWHKDKKERGVEYTLLWEALDLGRLPVRVAYHQSNHAIAIIEYRGLKFQPIDRALLTFPPDYLNMSPY
jgi:hypothetical protein